jgi:hypothetical protein
MQTDTTFPSKQSRKLTRKQARAPMPMPAVASGMKAPKCQVVLLDDDPVFGGLMELAGAKCGVSVKSRTPDEDVSDRELREADLILLDYDLESTTGLRWGTQLLERRIATPVLLVSGGQDAFRDADWPDNIRGFTSKELGPFGILDSIFQVLGRRTRRSGRGWSSVERRYHDDQVRSSS